ISYKALFEDALGFINKKERKLYFEAAYMNLHNMIFEGSVEKIITPAGNEYAFTAQGLAAYKRGAKKRDMNIMRKENVEQEFSAFIDSTN
ncbi:MAG: hypothetical protein KGH54_04650, partial [Candidatus Micrarchaeota archaeon]|nr:hypothetical protein [Candidatus Micrarchaeota archaeon]